ncbi:MAG: hypothetical protein IJB41_09170, partial [Clostridia bacterium]|nr:hypothetical protein [Clostridia bacterium]
LNIVEPSRPLSPPLSLRGFHLLKIPFFEGLKKTCRPFRPPAELTGICCRRTEFQKHKPIAKGRPTLQALPGGQCPLTFASA